MLTYFDLAFALITLFSSFMWFALWAMLRPLKKIAGPVPTSNKKVLLVIPCVYHEKLAENLHFFSKLKHPNLRAVYVTGTDHEPASEIVASICSEYEHCNHVIAGEATLCSQKNKNLLAALEEHKDFQADYYLFCDDDCRPQNEDWISYFVSHLKKPKVGAITSFRHVYLPNNPNLADFLYFFATTYQRASLRLTNSFVWGGAFALRRETFETHKVAKAWSTTAVDDIVTSHIIARAGLKIQFVQECMLHEDADPNTFSRFQAWMTRQFQYLYFYEPWGYWLSFVMLGTTLSTFFLLPIQLGTGFMESSIPATSICLFSIMLLGSTIAFLAQGMSFGKKLLCTLAIPVVVASTVLGLIKCTLTDRIKWKHKAYRIASDGSIAEVIDIEPTLPPVDTSINKTPEAQEIG